MIPLTKEQALKLVELQKAWMAKHPNASREKIERATLRIKFDILNKTNKI